MPTLRELQIDFADSIFSGEGNRCGEHIVADAFSGAARLQVYRNNVRSSLTAALKAVYPVVARLVGEGFFPYAAHEYITVHPSRSGNLHDFGERFPEFLGAFPAAAGLCYLPDVARLEWAWHRAFHGADGDCLSLDRLAQVPPDAYGQLRISLSPAAQLVASDFPVLRIWEVNQDGYEGDQAVDLDRGGERLLVTRISLEVVIHRLGLGEYAFLDALSRDATLAEACDAGLETDAGLDVRECLQRHVLEHTLGDFALS